MCLASTEFIQDILSAYTFTASRFIEEDGSITLSLNELDLIENAPTEEAAKQLLAKSIFEFSTDFYNDFSYWGTAPNRKKDAQGNVKFTKVSKGSGEIHTRMWKEILKKQLQVTEEYFNSMI